MIKYYESFQLYNTPSELQTNCNSFTMVNIGTATAIINGLEVLPGDQYVVLGNETEINISRYNLSFTGLGTNVVLVIRKIYQ